MEGGGQHAPLPHGDGPAVLVAGQDLDPVADLRHHGRADKNAVQRLVTKGRYVDVGLEGVQLAAVGVALDSHVKKAEHRRLAVGQPVGQQDHAGAGAEHRRTLAGHGQDRLAQPITIDQPPHEPITSAVVSGLRDEPSLDVLAGWLATRIDGPVQRVVGDLKVDLVRSSETITLRRPQTGVTATLTRTSRPEARIPLARREAKECLAEDLRRLDADEIFHEALEGIEKVQYV